MALSEENIKARLLQAFSDDNVSDDLTNLMADFSARFLYLEQITTANILMEGSYTRSKMLNSRIQHAADNFYSVPRGNNRQVRLSSVKVTEAINVEKFDIISTYGEYKLVHSESRNVRVADTVNFNCYLTLGVETLELQGSDKLYLEVPAKDISQDIIVIRKLTGEEYRLTDNIHDLDALQYGTSLNMYDMAVVTDTDFSVKLWMNTKFDSSETYIVKYLKCPDKDVPPLDLSTIINLPKMIKQNNTQIIELSSANYPVKDLDTIYQYTASFVKTKDVIRTVDNLDVEIQKYFNFKGFKTVIDPTTIKIYYVASYGTPDNPQGDDLDRTNVSKFEYDLRAHYVTQNVEYIKAGIAQFQDLPQLDVELEVQITDEINYDIVRDIVESYQGKVDEPLNFYQLIADIKGNATVGNKIKQIIIPNELMNVLPVNPVPDGHGGTILARPYFNSININYVFVKK